MAHLFSIPIQSNQFQEIVDKQTQSVLETPARSTVTASNNTSRNSSTRTATNGGIKPRVSPSN